MKMRSSPPAFSLVEVVLALGLVSFCLVALVSLLPVGLQSVTAARQRSAAASSIEKIAESIREASDYTNRFQAASSYSNLFWTIGGPMVSETLTNISLSGDPVTTSGPQLTARVQLTPPLTPMTTGTALISVAWPNQAKWNTATSTWTNASGSLTTWLMFIPRQ